MHVDCTTKKDISACIAIRSIVNLMLTIMLIHGLDVIVALVGYIKSAKKQTVITGNNTLHIYVQIAVAAQTQPLKQRQLLHHLQL